MTYSGGSLVLLVLALALALSLADVPSFTWDDVTDLDEYVFREDNYYSWELMNTIRYDELNATVYVVNMTSQKWLNESYVDRWVWWHWMGIAVPDELRNEEFATLWITGKSNGNFNPDSVDSLNLAVAAFSNRVGIVSAYICQIPNQKVVFFNNPGREVGEDALIAWSWYTHMTDMYPNTEVILRLPMTKGAKRGLDTIQEVVRDHHGLPNVNKFFVAGGSKRGWTTWSLAAVDPRVVYPAPMVFSLLNMLETVRNHYRSLGGAYSFAFEDYYYVNMTANLFNPRIQTIYENEDMYYFRERFRDRPKLLVSATGDEFFLLCDTWGWWDGMPEPKHFLLVPNAEHSLAPHYRLIYHTLAGVWISYMENIPVPEMHWVLKQHSEYSDIRMVTDTVPQGVIAEVGTTLENNTLRDWRLVIGYPEHEINPVIFYPGPVEASTNSKIYTLTQANDPTGEWTGFFMRARFEGPEGHNMTFMTQPMVTPNTFPAPPCLKDPDCYGYLT